MKQKKSQLPIIIICLSLIHNVCFGQSQLFKISKNPEELRIDKILKQLTLQEKVTLCSGAFPEFGLSGIKKLNIPTVHCTDGPRGPNQNGFSTAFPCGLAFGASWDPELVEQAGKVMGNETRAKKLSVLFGPGVNILRDPLGGRFFEYYTEDPFLNSAITVADIKGIQSEGVAACLKHYACNNRENNRNFYMSMVDDRTLNEIYLPAFKAGVQKGKVWTIMTSANGVNGEFVSDSKKMLTDILKNKWGYDGLVMTDFLQTRSTEKAALAGLDVSMPGGGFCGFGSALLDAVKAGRVPENVIDDKVRRLLRLYDRLGILDGKDMSIGATENTVQHQAVAQKVAEEGMVLLKNDRKLLPLNPGQINNIVVIGPNADKKFCLGGMGGGSSTIVPPYEITALQGLENMLGNNKVTYIPSNELGGFQSIPPSDIVAPDGTPGFKSSYFGTDQEHPAVNRKDSVLSFMWEMKSPDPRIKPQDFTHAHFEGKLIAPMDGRYTLRLTADGVAKMYHGFSNSTQIAFADRSQLLSPAFASVELKKGEPYELSIDYIKQPGDAGIRLEWELPQISDDKWSKITEAVKKADAVIFVGGLDYTSDTEGRDRNDLVFPGAQENLLNKLSAINKNVVAVLINGSPLELGGWLKNVPAVLEAWYPGMSCGTSISNILFGKTVPSGKLPFSWPKKLADCPSQVLGTENNDVVNYTDSLLVGYRYYDSKNVEPQFPFGYGLSYTTFKYDNLHIQSNRSTVSGSFSIKNTGNYNGAEVAEIYVRPLHPSVYRPVHELKYFKRITVNKSESGKIDFKLNADAFSYYDAKRGRWQLDPGKYEIQIGSSSRDIRLKAIVKVLN